jgi:uncharacterized protein YdhG (YjbR/CyaY superfamily)
LVKEIENITVYKNEGIEIDLSSYFYDEDGDELDYTFYSVDNITMWVKDSIARIVPWLNFTGKRYVYFTVSDGYYNISSNLFMINVVEKPLSILEVDVSEELVEPQVVINEPVRWVMRVNASDRVINLSVNISGDALNVSVRDVKEDKRISEDKIKVIEEGVIKSAFVYRAEKRILQIEEIEEKLTNEKLEIIRERPAAKQEISAINAELLELQNERNRLTGYVVASGSGGLLTRLVEWLFNVDITAYAVKEKENRGKRLGYNKTKKKDIQVIIEEPVKEVEIIYYTETVIAEETRVNDYTKQIVVSSEVHYENILAYTSVSPEAPRNAIRLYRIVNESRELVKDISYYDENNNNLIDKIEWIVPSLSNETYQLVIEITKAEHLDVNRNFIADIYDSVKALDGNWSPVISSGEYVRVTFEIPLDNTRDITLYPRVVSGTPRIEVYEIDGEEIIAEFESLIGGENKVFLTELIGEQDVFDLRIVDGSVEIDWVVDPIPGYGVDFIKHTIGVNFFDTKSVYAIDIDGDTDIDVLGAADFGVGTVWWENDGTPEDGGWTKHTIDTSNSWSVYAIDIDGDTDIDVLGAEFSDGKITWWENDGTPEDGGWIEHIIGTNFLSPTSVYAIDIDGEDGVDVLGASRGDDEITWWENDGTPEDGGWIEHIIDEDFINGYSVYAINMDGDTDIDVLGAAYYGDGIIWWENDGTPEDGGWIEHTIDISTNSVSVYAIDIDGDTVGK